jgi:hypothetical protein
MTWIISPHAVERLRERCAPDLSYDAAEALLAGAFPEHVVPLGKHADGQFRWALDQRDAVLITRPAEEGGVVLATVIPAAWCTEPGPEEWELEEMIRLYYGPGQVPAAAPEAEPPVDERRNASPRVRELQGRVLMLENNERQCRASKDAMKTARHVASMMRDRSVDRRALRMAVRALLALAVRGNNVAEAALEDIRSLSPTYSAEGFWGPPPTEVSP